MAQQAGSDKAARSAENVIFRGRIAIQCMLQLDAIVAEHAHDRVFGSVRDSLEKLRRCALPAIGALCDDTSAKTVLRAEIVIGYIRGSVVFFMALHKAKLDRQRNVIVVQRTTARAAAQFANWIDRTEKHIVDVAANTHSTLPPGVDEWCSAGAELAPVPWPTLRLVLNGGKPIVLPRGQILPYFGPGRSVVVNNTVVFTRTSRSGSLDAMCEIISVLAGESAVPAAISRIEWAPPSCCSIA